MCILFLHVASEKDCGDYSLILASNRDEFYDRPSLKMAPWNEDLDVLGGRDLQSGCNGGTWLALSVLRNKIGVLLNLPGGGENAKSRGKIVADYVKGKETTEDYIKTIKCYTKECNEFVFVSVELREHIPIIYSYSNATDCLTKHSDSNLGFGNCLPHEPLKKVEAGTQKLEEICSRLNNINKRKQLTSELLALLKSNERHLPDQQLEKCRPETFQQLSSIFVSIPEIRYGTRTHTIILVTKSGHIYITEENVHTPIDLSQPMWSTGEFKLDLKL